MSDDEVPDMGGMGDMGDMGGMGDSGSDDDMGDYNPPPELPEGVMKEIIKEADSSNWKKPKDGDEVFVHYVGTLESDGSEFDSSRSRGEEFSFVLGQGMVIKGWDVGVKTMKKGELAKFTLAPEYAYGEQGSPPKIPANATLVFEIELFRWVSKSDLFQDGGVIKAEVQEGSGWKSPKDGDEVKLTLKATTKDGATIEEKPGLEYTMGSGAMGPLSKAVDKALQGMKKGEVAQLTCTEEYAYGSAKPGGATVTLTLEQMYETKDISYGKDNTLIKKTIAEGEGWDTAKDTAKVTLKVEAATDGASALPGFSSQVLEFNVGNGEVCDALEFLAADMKKGEKAILTCARPSSCAEEKLGLKTIFAEKVVLTLEMQDFEKAKETYSMSEEEKIEFGAARKEVGSNLFRSGRMELAMQRYKKVIELFSHIDNFKEENKGKAKDLKKVCELNLAACLIKVKDFSQARTSCDNVLKDDAQNVKALFRKAQAEFGLKNFDESMRIAKKVVEVDPQNKEARGLYKDAHAEQKKVDQQAKGLFAKMCGGLGKGPIPAPGKSAGPMDEDFDGDEDDADLPETAADPPSEGTENKPSDETSEAAPAS